LALGGFAVLQGCLLPRLCGQGLLCKLGFVFSHAFLPSFPSLDEDNGNEEAATRIVWVEEGKLDLYLASRTIRKVGLSLRREFSVFCVVCWVSFVKQFDELELIVTCVVFLST